jgi:hypothetical protein
MGYLETIAGALAGMLLRASDPWIGRRVRAWFGDAADQGLVSMEGGTLHVVGARVPLGALALVDVRVAVEHALDLMRGLPVRVRVEHARVEGLEVPALTGTAALALTKTGWRVDDAIVTSGDLRVEMNAKGSFEDASARVDAHVDGVGATHLAPVLARFVRAIELPAGVVLTGDVTWKSGGDASVDAAVATALSRVTVKLAVGARGVGDVAIAGHVDRQDVLATRAVPEAIAARVASVAAMRATIDAVVSSTRAVRGTCEITTNESAATATIALAADGALSGTKLRGALSFMDAHALGLFPGPVRPRRVGAMDIDADVEGSLAAPSIAGIVASPALRLRLGDDAALPTIVFHDVALHLAVDARRVVWRDLEARVLGGKLASSGSVTLGANVVLDAIASCAGVRLEAIPSNAEGKTPLAETLRGALHAEVRLGYASKAFAAFGRARVVEPDYVALAGAGEKLARYGLTAPSTRGVGPVEGMVSVRDRVARAESITARLDGIDVEGDVQVGFDGALEGALRAHLLQRYLRRSVLLAIPAALAERVVIPVTFSGTVHEPRVSADLVHTLDDFLENTAIGTAVANVVDEVWNVIGGTRSK